MTSDREVPQGADGADAEEASAKPVDPVAGKTVAEVLGEIVWLMTQDPAGREMKVAEIEALIVCAGAGYAAAGGEDIAADQCRNFRIEV